MNDKQLEKVRKGDFLLLPHYMKWAGIILVLIGVTLFFTQDYQSLFNGVVLVSVSGNLVLLGFLLIILSNEKLPYERLLNIRHKAMAYAFMHGMTLVIVLPFLNYFAASLLNVEMVSYFMDFVIFSVFTFQTVYLINYWRFKRDL
jgi:hypothetical protein